jgi:uncharacterized alpha-E superfamily protein
MERAEFTADLVEATLRLDALAARPAGREAWSSALAVAAARSGYAQTGASVEPAPVARFLLLSAGNRSSSYSCIEAARSNARAARTSLSREVWLSINQAWIELQSSREVDAVDQTLALIERIKAGARGFEGAMHRMLRNEAQFFIALGAAVERANGTARLFDVKYHLLLPTGERVGGPVDRDQWTAILRTVSAATAYRWLYREGLKPRLVAELLVLRDEFPRSLTATIGQAVQLLDRISERTGCAGEADRLARRYLASLQELSGSRLIEQGLHEYVLRSLSELAQLDQAIAKQFRFN